MSCPFVAQNHNENKFSYYHWECTTKFDEYHHLQLSYKMAYNYQSWHNNLLYKLKYQTTGIHTQQFQFSFDITQTYFTFEVVYQHCHPTYMYISWFSIVVNTHYFTTLTCQQVPLMCLLVQRPHYFHLCKA